MTSSPKPSSLSRRTFLQHSGILMGGAVLLGAAACGRDGNGQGQAGGDGQGQTNGERGEQRASYQGEAAITHLTAIVHSAPFHIAQRLGYYEEAGLDIEQVSFPGGSDTVRGMESGIPFGSPAALPIFIAWEKGLKDLRIIGGAYNAAAVDFIVPVDSEIESIDDLGGKKVAVSTPGANSTYFADRTVREAGFTPGQDVELVSVGGPGDAWTAASEGVVDVAWTAAPLLQRLEASGEARTVWQSSDFVENWVDTCLATTQQFIDSSPEVLQAWVNAVQRAMDLIKDDPQLAAEEYGAAVDLDPEVALAALQARPEAFSTKLDMAGLEENVSAGKEQGQLTEDPDMDQILVRDFTA